MPDTYLAPRKCHETVARQNATSRLPLTNPTCFGPAEAWTLDLVVPNSSAKCDPPEGPTQASAVKCLLLLRFFVLPLFRPQAFFAPLHDHRGQTLHMLNPARR